MEGSSLEVIPCREIIRVSLHRATGALPVSCGHSSPPLSSFPPESVPPGENSRPGHVLFSGGQEFPAKFSSSWTAKAESAAESLYFQGGNLGKPLKGSANK